MLTYKCFLLHNPPDTNAGTIFSSRMGSVSLAVLHGSIWVSEWHVEKPWNHTCHYESCRAVDNLFWIVFTNCLQCWCTFPVWQTVCTNHLRTACLQDVHPALGTQKEPPASCCLRMLHAHTYAFIIADIKHNPVIVPNQNVINGSHFI